MSRRRSLYLRFGKVIAPLAIIALRIQTSITQQPRVRVFVINEFDEILLVKGVISKAGRWSMPGGGVNRREKNAVAAKRELYEETGIEINTKELTYLRTVTKADIEIRYNAPVFSVKVKKEQLPDVAFNPIEIADIQWFSRHRLPHDTEPIVYLANETFDKKR